MSGVLRLINGNAKRWETFSQFVKSMTTTTCPSPSCRRRLTREAIGVDVDVDPPIPKKIPVSTTKHGITWTDSYKWMSNTHDPSLKSHLERENEYTQQVMAATVPLQQLLLQEMHSRIPPVFSTPPEKWGPWYYYQHIPEGKEYPILCRRRPRKDGLVASFLGHLSGYLKEEVLLDWNEIAKQFGYVHVGKCRISPDHRYLAYTLDVTGRESFDLHVKDIETGSKLESRNAGDVVSLAWSNDGKTLLYTVTDEAQRPYKVFARQLDSDHEDILLFEENDESFCVDIMSTKDCQFITINSNSRTSSEVYIINSSNIKGGLKRIRARVTGVQYFLEHHCGYFYILTNAALNDARMPVADYYLSRCRVEDIESNKWQNVIQMDEEVIMEDMDIFDKHMVLFLYRKGIPMICSLPMPLNIGTEDQDGMKLKDLNPWFLPVPTETCVIVPGSNHDFSSSIFRAVISSPVMPDTVVDFDLSRQSFTIVHQEDIKILCKSRGRSKDHKHCAGIDDSICQSNVPDAKKEWADLSEMYCCERKEVVSYDSVKIPLTIVYSKNVKQNGKNPGLIHGYGAYGELLDKQWCSEQMSLLDRGWVIAYADVRGGGGGGKSWHNAGKGLQKPNSIYDFIACSRYLIDGGYVHTDKLGAMAHSAGGLLLGAAINMCPDLFRAAVLKVPFLDACNTLLDPSLPLTVLDYEEFGDPRNFVDFAVIRSYSPYDHIQQGCCYPAMLVITSFNDSRVGVWEATKWVVKMRENQAEKCSQPILLKTNMNAGHLGEGGRYEYCNECAFEYAFLFKMMGL